MKSIYIYVSNPDKSQLVALMETNDHNSTWFPLSLCMLNNFDISFLVSFSQDVGAKNLIFPGWPAHNLALIMAGPPTRPNVTPLRFRRV